MHTMKCIVRVYEYECFAIHMFSDVTTICYNRPRLETSHIYQTTLRNINGMVYLNNTNNKFDVSNIFFYKNATLTEISNRSTPVVVAVNIYWQPS